MSIRIACDLGSAFGNIVDRFLPSGYREEVSLEVALQQFKGLEGADGVCLDYPLTFQDPVVMQGLLDKYDIPLCVVEVGIFGEHRWRKGSLTAPDPAIRRQAIDVLKRGMDVTAEMGQDQLLLWPGQDGYEYPFQPDFDLIWGYLVDGIREVAEYRPEINIGIEYKPKEPRTRCYVDTAARTLLLCQAIGLPNVGVTVDQGHSLFAQENPGQAVALCARHNRLFQVHVNDNYGDWDSDLLVGQVNFWSALEFFHWLHRVGFDDWYLLDFFPFREDGPAALAQCARNTRRLAAMAARLPHEQIAQLQQAADPLPIAELLWQETIKF